MSFNEKKRNEFLDIPYAEHIVPFPNFATVIMQHAREFPDKIALGFNSRSYTYSELIKTCLALDLNSNIILSMKDPENNLIIFLALLVQGISFKLDFKADTILKLDRIKQSDVKIHYFEPPYVRLDDEALILNKELSFSQYNVLVAAQAIGNAFKLFRPGNALCPMSITSIADLSFGILAPLYFAKSIYFVDVDEPDFFQYAWNGVIRSDLRDAVMVGSEINNQKNAYHLKKSFDNAMGIGKVISSKGKEVTFLGFEIEDEEPRGHCLGRKILE